MKKVLLFVLLVLTVFSTFFVASRGNNKARAITDVPSTGDSTINITESTIEDNSAAANYLHHERIDYDQSTGTSVHTTYGAFDNSLDAALKILIGQDQVFVYDAETGERMTTASGEPIYASTSGALDSVFAVNGQLYTNPPGSGIDYTQQQWAQITTGSRAYAADDSWIYYPGLGFQILEPIQEYWAISRNLAYTVMIIIIIIVALMVIFQGYFGGQTQVTIANSIPNIIIALLMITLSYALSGFAIDLITVGVNLTQQVLVQNEFSPGYEVWTADEITTHPSNPLHLPEETLKQLLEDVDPDNLGMTQDEFNQFIYDMSAEKIDADIQSGNFKTGTGYDYKVVLGGEGNPAVKNYLQPDDEAMSIWSIFGTSNIQLDKGDVSIANVIPNTNSNVVQVVKHVIESAEKVPGANNLINVLFGLVLAISAFMAALKLFLKLLTKYMILALYPIISPFIMLTIAIPGMGMKSVSGYFRTLFAAAITFIAIYAVFLFMLVLTNDTKFAFTFDYTPSLIGYDFRTIGDNGENTIVTGNFIKNLLAYGLFVSTPVIPDFIEKSLLGAERYQTAKATNIFGANLQRSYAEGQMRVQSGARMIGKKLGVPDRPKQQQG